VGIGGRFPNARDVGEFWENLLSGKSAITTVPERRWTTNAAASGDDAPRPDQFWGGFIDDADCFDATFFRISPKEAHFMDPQQRLLLQVAWHTFENAGVKPSSMAGSKVGVFIGVCNTDYGELLSDRKLSQSGLYASTGTSTALLSNRLSFFFDFHGPSVTVDTACSSSLVAVHLAVQAIRAGECESALAGGVNVCWTSDRFLAFSRAGMLSKEGQCRTFDARANGYVRGEGVGVVLLKSLSRAVSDADHIHGVIKGSAISHGGRTNGLTITSPQRQSQLLIDAYRKANISPRTVGYVEVHGTGTSIGDPIEFLGLKMGFAALRKEFGDGSDSDGSCALGALKTHIGHLEAAAGIAGLIKVLLALEHKVIPANLNFGQLNPMIDLHGSRFYVPTSIHPWKPMASGKRKLPRRAGVSSFGYGGAYAHVIVEEYANRRTAAAAATLGGPFLLVLSAHNAERLRAWAGIVAQFLDKHASARLVDLAYSLQVAKEELAERVALVVTDVASAIAGLRSFSTSAECNFGMCFQGRARKSRANAADTAMDGDSPALDQLARAWTTGASVDWPQLYGDCKPLRIPLPLYPFSKDRYWVDSNYETPRAEEAHTIGQHNSSATAEPQQEKGSQRVHAPASAGSALHPLAQVNTSTFSEQRFTSKFSGAEFYLSDHVVKGVRILPGVTYLEMARAAVLQSSDGATAIGRRLELKNVVWMQPLEVAVEREAHIGLHAQDSTDIGFEIYTCEPQAGGAEVVHAQGRAEWLAARTEDVDVLDLAALRSRCAASIDIDACYAAFVAMGIDYGAAHRGLVSVQIGTQDQDQRFVLAQVKLPPCVNDTSQQYYLHPSVLDGALQASVGLSLFGTDQEVAGRGAAAGPTLPFALEKLQILDRSPGDAWVYVRPSAQSAALGEHSSFRPTRDEGERNRRQSSNGTSQLTVTTSEDTPSIRKLDIDVCDASGRVCVRLKGYTSRVMHKGFDEQRAIAQKQDILLLSPGWTAKPLPTRSALQPPMDYGERWVLLSSMFEGRLAELKSRLPSVNWTMLPETDAADSSIAAEAEMLLELVRSLLRAKPQRTVQLQVLVDAENRADLTSALSGLLKSARQEHPKIKGQVIALPGTATSIEIVHAVEENGREECHGDTEIRYAAGIREAANFLELSPAVDAGAIALPWKDGGVYLLTGGAGGLGMIFAREIAGKVRHARIILTGRSSLDERKQARVDALRHHGEGTQLEYRVLDVTDQLAVEHCVADVVGQYGSLDGIVHGAGVIRDNFILKKSNEELRAVLAPKVLGTLNLDRAAKDVRLDFLILFSSVSAILGNVGQSDYATANAFLDCYAKYRHRLVQAGQRFGKTLSINWPLWADGGMAVDSGRLEQMRRQGFGVLSISAGIRALYRAWQSDEPHVAVLAGDRRKLERLLRIAPVSLMTLSNAVAEELHTMYEASPPLQSTSSAPSSDPAAIDDTVDAATLLRKIQKTLVQAISQQLRVKEEDVDEEAQLSDFGFDSISLTSFGNYLNDTFGLELSPAIFFEYPTVCSFAQYLVCEHAALLADKFAVRAAVAGSMVKNVLPSSTDAPADTTTVTGLFTRGRTRLNHVSAAVLPQPQVQGPEPVSIIGMSGCFPAARDIDEFWENLRSGKDCITEIPSCRWDWQAIYGDPALEPNKTNIKWGGFIEQLYEFDPLFFGISPKEAQLMDPQQRLLMMHAWKAIEDAGYCAQSLSGSRTGIFVGTANSGYGELVTQANIPIDAYSSTGAIPSVGPNRMSYFLNLHGPSEPIDTACSSSLVAIHHAVRAIRSGDCEAALVGGINTLVLPWAHISFSKAGMLSEDGRCKTFSKEANGYVRAEGAGILFLKQLSAAERDGDRIYAVVRASSQNHGGRANSLTAPNPKAQAELIKAAYREADIDPRTVTYIETHGTGTPLGDPIEINGLKAAFAELYSTSQGTTQLEGPGCGIGSVKTNIGHLELAAGVAGVIKVLLQLKHRTLVKSLHCEDINPYIQLQGSPFYVVRENQFWQPVRNSLGDVLPRRAGVSSFGFGGVNAHVVIEEYSAARSEQPTMTAVSQHPTLVVLSAKTAKQLQAQASQLAAYIARHACAEVSLSSIGYTLQVGREAMDHRLAFAATTIDELREKLAAYLGETGGGDVEAYYQGEVKQNKASLAALTDDPEFAETVAKWMQRGKYEKLLDLWAKGLNFDWSKLYAPGFAYAHVERRRISLPTYPFDTHWYWIDSRPLTQPGREAVADRRVERQGSSCAGLEPKTQETIEPLLFTEEWHASAIRGVDASRTAQTAVVLLSNPQHQSELSAAIAQANGQMKLVFVARPNCWQAQASDMEVASSCAPMRSDGINGYEVQHESAASYTQVFSRILEDHGRIDAVCYLWVLEGATSAENHASIVQLIKGLAHAGIKQTKVLLAGEYRSALQRCYLESWIGYARSIGRVLPEVQIAVIHVERAAGLSSESNFDSASIKQWAHRLRDELRADTIESALYIGEQRHVLRMSPVASDSAPARLRIGGTYLITGGLGGLGYLVARHLAQVYSAKLILLGRSAANEDMQAKLSALEALGGQAAYMAADVSDTQQLRAAVARGRQRFGPLHGAIHAAGVERSASLLSEDIHGAAAVLSPKIAGTLALDELLQDQELEFICHFSSISAVLGDLGSCEYAVANRFQVAHAKYMNRRALAICWPLWADGAMGFANNEATELYLKSTGQRALGATQGIELLERLLAQREQTGLSHVIVVLGERDRVYPMMGLSPACTDVSRPVTLQSGRNPELQGLTFVQCVLWELKELASELLQIPRDGLDAHENLAEFGFDSIGLASFAKHLSARFGIEVLPSVFFSHATLQKLAGHLLSKHTDAMQRRYTEERVAHDSSGAHREQMRVAVDVNIHSPARVSIVPARSAQTRSGTDDWASSTQPKLHQEPIAIIGMSGRFPQARDVEQLWQILLEGKEAVEEIPLERFDWRKFYHRSSAEQDSGEVAAGRMNSKWLGVLPGVDEFDPLFFEISPKAAQSMDPRQRLLLQESFKALEDAGYGSAQLERDKTGMFVGVEQGDYQALLGSTDTEADVTSNHDGILAARLSYFLDLHGPAMAINTACSSGLVALHQACLSLRAEECDAAIAAGVNLILTPQVYVGMSQAGMLSPDGRCHAFDCRANGMVPAEAVVAVVLKRLSQAQAHGDLIYAVVRGSGINCDGKTNGMTAPNGAAQAQLIREVYARAQVDHRQIEYIVTHGTGTRLGDPVEINALRDVFADVQTQQPYCALTSTKTNLGHTFAASGLVSLVSVVQALRYQTIPASLHCEQLSNYIDWNSSPFYINRQNTAWPIRAQKPRMAAVSAFGMSGTNAHVVVESCVRSDASSQTAPTEPQLLAPCYLLALSAKTETALQQRIEDLISTLANQHWDAPALAAMSYTLLNHRQHFTHRCAVVVMDRDHAVSMLDKARGTETLSAVWRGKAARDFSGRVALAQYGNELLSTLHSLRLEPQRYQESLIALADLYCQGYQLDWQALYRDQPVRRRIRLPTYPFERDRHWIEQVGSSPVDHRNPKPKTVPVSACSRDDSARWLEVTERWTATPLNEQAWPSIAQVKGAQRVIVLYRRTCDLEGIRKALAQNWAGNSNRVLLEPVQLPEQAVAADVDPLGHYLAKHQPPEVVFYFSGVVEDAALAHRELKCVLHASQTLIKRASAKSIQFYYCYPATHTVAGLYQEGLSGLFRAIASECPAHHYRSVEFPDDASSHDYAAIVREWLQHSVRKQAPAQLPMVRYRDGKRYVAALTELTDERPMHKPVELRRDATYLIVGGLGEVGRILCRTLAHAYQPRLVILSRRSLDPDIRQHLAEISDAGAQVIYRSVDITDEGRLAATLREIKTESGALHGVFHLARSVSDGPLQDKSFAAFAQTIAAKVEGTFAVDNVTAGEPLDFFVVYSSMASFGLEGSADYCYATAFQNAFVRARNQRVERGERAGRSLALCWGQWQADTYLSEQRSAAMRLSGFDFIEESSALSVVEANLRCGNEVMGLVAVSDKQHVRKLYGLIESSGEPAAATLRNAENTGHHAALERTVVELGAHGNTNFNAVRTMLRDHSYDELAELYETLTNGA
jgi:acyl transferase domain-containing protein/acyl carrier protein